tara:strand:+ start:37 stop:213 length:177 start_codon:yes stop_codon:yes gene_type:complete
MRKMMSSSIDNIKIKFPTALLTICVGIWVMGFMKTLLWFIIGFSIGMIIKIVKENTRV